MERGNVLVTGASRGIGAAIARTLAARGYGVFVAARGLARCEELAHELEGAGGRAWPLELDVAAPASIARAVADARELGGGAPPAALVNNAGIAESAPLSKATDATYERHMDVNFHGPRRLIEALLPAWKESGRGRVVNVASSAGLRGYAYVAAYCASKFALVGYTLAVAQELGDRGITVNAVCPHYVDSPMLASAIRNLVGTTGRTEAEARAFFAGQNPGGKLVSEAAVAESVAELLEGDESGLVVELDGTETKLHRPNGA